MRWSSRAVHEGVVDGDDEDLAGVLDLGVLDVAGDVGVGAGWAWVLSAHVHVSNRAYFPSEAIAIGASNWRLGLGGMPGRLMRTY